MPPRDNSAVPSSDPPALPAPASRTNPQILAASLPARSGRGNPITEPDPDQLIALRQRLLSACDTEDLDAISRERDLVARMRPSSHWSERAWVDVCLSMAIVEAVYPGTMSKDTANEVWTGFYRASTYDNEVQGMGAATAFALGAAGRTHGIARSGIVHEILCARRDYLMPSLLLGLYLTAGLTEGPVRAAVGSFLVDLAAENRRLRKEERLPVGRDGPLSSERALVISGHGLTKLFPKVNMALWAESAEYRFNLSRAARELIAADPELSARLDEGLTRHLNRRQGGLAQLSADSVPLGTSQDSRPKRLTTGKASRALMPAAPSALPAPAEPGARSLLRFLGAHTHQILAFAEEGYRASEQRWREQVAAWMRHCSW